MTPGLNLESCSNQLSKFCYYHSPKNSPHRLTPNRLQESDSWQTYIKCQNSSPILVTSRLLMNGPPTDPWQATDRSPDLGPRWSVPFLEMTPGLNLESCPNQLSKFGELSKSAFQIWLLSDSQKTLSRLSKTVSTKVFGWWHQFSIWRAVQISSPNLVTNRLLIDF